MVRKPVVVVNETWFVLDVLERFRATVRLYSLGVPRLWGYHLSGTSFGMCQVACTHVALIVVLWIGETGSASDFKLSSGMDSVSVGLWKDDTERSAREILTTQSAAWSGATEKFWLTL